MKHLTKPHVRFKHFLSAPFIYSGFIPFVILDINLEIYHQVCFRLYDIPLIDRKKYIKIDRHKLKYLNPLQKINCMYCGYMNGGIEYMKAIINETEKYWCGIAHQVAETSEFIMPEHHKDFMKYGDEASYNACKLARIEAERKYEEIEDQVGAEN